MNERPTMPDASTMRAAMRAAIEQERKRRLADAKERVHLIAKINRGGVKHPHGATKATPPRATRRAKAKAGRKAARRTR